MGRLRASRELDNRSCPGQSFCTTNIKGEIASPQGKVRHRTLENFCHDKPATVQNGLQQGCPLYPTKPENVRQELIPLIGLAEDLRVYKKRGALLDIEKLGCIEWTAFSAAEDASDVVEAEAMEEATNKGGSSDTVGKMSPMGRMGESDPVESAMKW